MGFQRVDILVRAKPVQVIVEDRQFVLGFQRQAGADHDGLDVEVEQDPDERVLERGNDNRLVDERIFRPAHPQQAGPKIAFLLFADIVYDQHFVIGAAQGAGLGRQRSFVFVILVVDLVG